MMNWITIFIALIMMTICLNDGYAEETTFPTSDVRKRSATPKIGINSITNAAEKSYQGVGELKSPVEDVLKDHKKLFDSVLDHGLFGWFKSNKPSTK